LSNYRPVSPLTSFSKNIWNGNADKELKHLTKYNILSSEPYGFQIGLKMDNAIYKLTTVCLKATNNKLLVGEIFCDLEKAFDFVDYDILLSKLQFYGILHFIILIWITDRRLLFGDKNL
jgi:hypothetical protein